MLISNPLDNPLFRYHRPLAGHSVVRHAGRALIQVRRGIRPPCRESVLFRRWRVWAIIPSDTVWRSSAACSPRCYWSSFLIIQGLREYARLVGLPGAYLRVLLTGRAGRRTDRGRSAWMPSTCWYRCC